MDFTSLTDIETKYLGIVNLQSFNIKIYTVTLLCFIFFSAMVKAKDDMSTGRVATIAGSVSGIVIVTILGSIIFAVIFFRKR